MEIKDKKELFRTLVGSYNYNLNTETSDKDYKVFIAPSFDDLYSNKIFSKTYITETEDFDCHDIRKIPNLFWKSNVNFLEILFSKEIILNPNLPTEIRSLIRDIFKNKERIARMNLPYLYNACVGMAISKQKGIDKGTEETKHLIEKFGFDTKQAMNSVRILDFLRRFADYDFKKFNFAIRYDDNENFKNLLLDIKLGIYSREEFLDLSNNLIQEVESKYKEIYYSKNPDEQTYNYLTNVIKEIVKKDIIEDLKEDIVEYLKEDLKTE